MKALLAAAAICFPVITYAALFADGELYSKDGEYLLMADAERGEINGVKYFIYRRGGGAVFAGNPSHTLDRISENLRSNWDVQCKRDPIDDARHCTVRIHEFWVYMDARGRHIVSVGTDTFPGSTTLVRIGDSKPFSTSHRDGTFSYEASARMVSLMRPGTKIVTRHMKWPYRSWVDQEWTAFGLQEALTYARWLIKRI